MTNHAFTAFVGPHAGSDAPFLRMPDGPAWIYADLVRRAARMHGVLQGYGLVPGDRVAVQVAKAPEALALYAACLRGGFAFLPLNTAYTPSEVDYFASDAGAAMLVCDSGARDVLAPVADAAGARLAVLADLAAAEAGEPEVAPCGPDDLAAILYTSGTTGRSKGAMLTHANLVSNATTLAQAWRFTGDDVLIHALPIFHTHGLFVATNVTLVAGSSMVFLSRFDPDAILDAMPRATAMMGVPTFFTRLLDHPGLTRDVAGPMRLFVSGSAPLLAETHRAWEARTGHRILERYGMTETNMNTSNPYDGDRRAGTVGPPLPGVEVRVTAEGAPLPPGETGVVEVRGPNVFKGYWRMPEKTAEELRPDGWFVTGDLGQLSPDGYLSIVGRQKDLVISGGYNIYPKEVETVLDDLPGVAESAVFGAPHPDMGEGLVGVVVPSDPGEPPDAEALLAALGDRLARFKQPRRLEVVDVLPRNTMGKVQKNVLRERYAETFAGGGA